jgi:hypothetical protein
MNRLFMIILTTALLAAAACSDGGTDARDDVTTDAVDGGSDLDVAATDVDDPGTGDSLADVPDLTPDTGPYVNGAQAFVTTSADQLIGGVQAAGAVGDTVLSNAHVRFVVRSLPRSLYSPYAGALVDADVVRPAGELGHDKFFEIFPMTGFGRIFKPTDMRIVDDGAFTGTAIVRFTGTDGGMTIIDSILPTTPMFLEVTTDYILAPDARYIQIATTLRNAGAWSGPINVGQILQFGKRLDKFHDHCGIDQACLSSRSDIHWLAAQAGDVSYGLTVPAGQALSMLLNVDELMLLEAASVEMADGESLTFRQYLAVGTGTVDDVLPILRAIRGEGPAAAVQVHVSLADTHSSLGDARVRALRTDDASEAYASTTIPGSDGNATLHLAPGTYDFEVVLPGADAAVLAGVAITQDGPNVVDLVAHPAGWLHVRSKDGADAPVTAALALQPGLDAAWQSSISRFEAIRDGDYRFPMAAGDYTATLSRGMVWTIDRKNVTVTAGSETLLEGTVLPAIDTTGSVMVNTHEHSEMGIDSYVPVEDRVYNALANGIQVMNAADHDHFATHQGTIQRLGLQDQVIGFWGAEISPLEGHTTANGCLKPPAYDQYYTVDFLERDADGAVARNLMFSEIHARAREDLDCQFLASAHPYDGSATFTTYGITATSNPADALPGLDLRLLDAMEIYNGGDDVASILGTNLPAWFNLLNRGYSIAAIGGSDEHGYSGNYGVPRNMVPVDAPNPGDVDPTDLFGRMKAFTHEVVGGPILRITVNGATMGQTVAAQGASVQVHLQVLAPAWMQLSFVRVYANGVLVREPVPADTTEVVRLDETFDLPLTNDAHIVAVAGSLLDGHQMTPVSKHLPFSATNPVFVDVDGGGYKALYKDGAPWDVDAGSR